MKEKTDVLQGTLALMLLTTLDVLGPPHGYGIARRIEQISGDLLRINHGTLYPVLLKLEREVSQFNQQRLIARLTSLFGILSLLLTSIGLYGITAYNAGRRINEIGVRMAFVPVEVTLWRSYSEERSG